MNTKPIIFSGPMIRVLLDGRKTQTRRVMRPQPIASPEPGRWQFDPPAWFRKAASMSPHSSFIECDPRVSRNVGKCCPYGQPGDLIWVREAFADLRGTGIEGTDPSRRFDVAYSADVRPGSAADEDRKDFGIKWKPSIHMPRWAARLTLRITDIRVERVRDISDADQLAEGAPMCFAESWDSIYATRGYGWKANPWVWALTFDVIHANVDTVAERAA